MLARIGDWEVKSRESKFDSVNPHEGIERIVRNSPNVGNPNAEWFADVKSSTLAVVCSRAVPKTGS